MSGDTPRATPDDISDPQSATPPDPRAKKERVAVFGRKENFTELRNQRFRDQSQQLNREHRVRLRAARVVFRFVCGWLIFVGVVVFVAGVGWLPHLSEKVLIALLGTTTVTVVGLLAVVVRYLFPVTPSIFGHDSLPTTRGRKPDKMKSDKKPEEE